MKKIMKKLTFIGAAAIPTASLVACGTEPGPVTPDTPTDKQAITNNIAAIKSLPKTANAIGKNLFPVGIANWEELYATLTEHPTETEGVKISPLIQTRNNVEGSVTVLYTLTKNQDVGEVTIKYTDFKSNWVTISIGAPLTGAPNAIPFAGAGWSQQIDDTHYLIGTFSQGVYQVEVDQTTGMVTTSKQVPSTKTGNKSIPNVSSGWSQKIDDTHYLIGTTTDGVYQVTIDTTQTNWVTEAKKVTITNDPWVQNGWSQQIDNTHYLIGTAKKTETSTDYGVYQVTIDITQTEWVTKSEQVPTTGANSIPNVMYGWSQQIDSTHYLISTASEGVYEVTIDITNETSWVTKTKQIESDWTKPNSIPDAATGWSEKIDATHYLVGTRIDGVYEVTIDITNETSWVTKSKKDSNILTSGSTGWITKIGNSSSYLIGTQEQGVYQVVIDVNNLDNWITKATQTPMVGMSSIPDVGGGWIQQTINSTKFLIGTHETIPGTGQVYQVTLELPTN